jgi:type IV fimbrial biogenesis protein FimT
MKTKQNNGYTLLEIMIALSIAGILMAIAIPSFSTFIKNNRSLAETNSLMTAIKTARTEAMTRRTTVSVCRSVDNVNCGTAGDNFIAFTDAAITNVVDGTDVIVFQTTINSDNLTLDYTGGAAINIRFDSRGRAIGTSGTITVCDNRGDDYKRGITIEPIGRSKPAVGGSLDAC